MCHPRLTETEESCGSFCATVVISELLITIQRTEIDASMLALSDDFFQLQDTLMAEVIQRLPLWDFDRKMVE